MIEKFDLSSIRAALEHTPFADFRIRDAINVTIKALELDLDEIGFEPSENTMETFEALDACVVDVETESKKKMNFSGDYRIDSDDTEEIAHPVNENEIIEENVRSVINVDAELDEEGV